MAVVIIRDAEVAFHWMGKYGMQLRVPHDGSQPEIVDNWGRHQMDGDFPIKPSVAVDPVILPELTTRLWKMREHMVDQRLGWREARMDGDVADWYVHIQ